MASDLSAALQSVDWGGICSDFIKDEARSKRVTACIEQIALWSAEIQNTDRENLAIPFVREMHASAMSVTASLALGLYKSAAGGMRAILESALYYSYFRDHPVELATLVRDEKYYISRKYIMDFHKEHTPDFIKRQEPFGLISKIESWYSNISAIVHGQIPGVWSPVDIGSTKYSDERLEAALVEFEKSCGLVHVLLLVVCSPDRWSAFSPASKEKLTKGLSAEQKKALGISKK
jgi:hypothetical protein